MNEPNLLPLYRIMQRLRDPENGCPWDIKQSFATIIPYTIEEAYEVADAVERNDLDALKDELGDLLLQVMFHAQMASEQNAFAIQDVIDAICDKMTRRHPHVFGDENAETADQVKNNWEAIKAQERKEKSSQDSILSDIPSALPALMRAEKLQKRAARVGFDWPDPSGAKAKIDEEMAEIAAAQNQSELEEEFGDLFFAAVNWARKMGVQPEDALRRANQKFEKRFHAMEKMAGEDFAALSLEEKETLWDAVKRQQ